MSDEKASDLYQDAIAKLKAVSADFATDDATRAEANAQITELRDKIQDAALDEIAARTSNLKELSGKLNKVLGKAQGTDVSGLQAVLQRVQKAIGV